jgi:hypothetical protein
MRPANRSRRPDAAEIVLTADAYRSDEVTQLPAPFTVAEQSGIMQGVEETIPVFESQHFPRSRA